MTAVLYLAYPNLLAPVNGGALKRAVIATGLAQAADLALALIGTEPGAAPIGTGVVELPLGGTATVYDGPSAVSEALATARPDVVIVDHVSYVSALGPARRDVALIVNTQNVESSLAWEERRIGGLRSRVNAARSTTRLWRQERVAFGHADQLWFVSDEDERLFRRLHRIRSPTAIVPNVVADWAIADDVVPGRPRTAVFLGSLNYWANRLAIVSLGELSVELTRRGEAHAFDVIGSGSPSPPITGLPPEVHLRGFVDHLLPALESYGACIAPITAGGGTKTKLLEAMAAGRAVLTTPKGVQGIPEARDGHNIMVRELGPAFVEAAATLLGDPTLALRLGREGLATVRRRYTLKASGAAVSQALSELLAAR